MGSGIGGTISDILGVGGDGGASDIQRQALAEFQKLQFPSIEEQKLYLQKLIQQGKVTPEQAQTYSQGSSAYDDIQSDPEARGAEVSALQALQGIGTGGGMTDVDRARVMDLQDQFDTTSRGARDAVMQNAAQRGTSGSGLDLANQMSANQEAATTGARRTTDIAADAQTRALQALTAAGQTGSQLNAQDYAQGAQKAAAQNTINQFNTSNKQNVAALNTGANNQAQYYNQGVAQNVSDQNANNANSAAKYNSGLYQQQFNNQLSKAQGMAGQYNNIANTALDQEKRKDAFTGQIIGTAGQVGASMAGAGGKGMSKGGRVPGVPRVPGNSPMNDTIPAMLSPGETVIPRSPTMKTPRSPATPGPSGVHPKDLESMLSALSNIRRKGRNHAI